MRSDIKASTARSTQGKVLARRRFAAFLSTLTVAIGLMTLTTSPATAAVGHFFLERFGSTAKPVFPGQVIALAVDQAGEKLLVVSYDGLEANLYRYNMDGMPANFSALGTNVISDVHAADSRNSQIAVDDSGAATDGNFYLTDETSGAIRIFSSTGSELGQISQYEQGPNGDGALANSAACGVAVDSSGSVYVGDRSGQIHKYVPTANVPINTDNTANFSHENACALASGSGPTAGFLFVRGGSDGKTVSKLDASTGEVKYVVADNVRTLSVDPNTGHLYAFRSQSKTFTHYDVSGADGPTTVASVTVGSSEGGEEGKEPDVIAVRGSTGHVYIGAFAPESGPGGASLSGVYVYTPLLTLPEVEVLPAEEVSATKATLHGRVNPQGLVPTDCKFEYGTVKSGKFPSSIPCEELLPGDEGFHEVSAVIGGLAAGVEYQVRLVVANSSASNTSNVGTFKTPLRVFTGPPKSVSAEAGTVAGVARPEGQQLSECFFEYGLSTLYESTAPCVPSSASIPADFKAYAVSSQLNGLRPSTIYHYRLVIGDEGGQFLGKDEVFRTRGFSGLPDGRAYEQVSPVDKNQNDILGSAGVASIDGDRVHFMSRGAFADSPTSVAFGLPYMATRGPGGWKTKGIAMPNGHVTLGFHGYLGFTPDLSRGVIRWPDDSPTYDPNAVPGINTYMRDSVAGSFQLLNGTLDEIGLSGIAAGDGLVWGSDDFDKLAIDSKRHLTDDSPCPDVSNCAYEWDNGTLRLASILPGGAPVIGAIGSTGPGNCNYEHAMSDDGSRLFFTSPPGVSATSDLYARENGIETHKLSASERTSPGGASGNTVYYQSAEAARGDRVLFTTANSLVDEDTDSTRDLYMYDFTRPAGEHLTLISEDRDPSAPVGANVIGDTGAGAPPCGGFLGASEDLRRIYFAASNQIVEGEPNDPGPKIFLWDDTGTEPQLTYIAAVNSNSEDERAWSAPSVQPQEGSARTARWSTDGRYLAFISTAQLSEFGTEGRKEIYLYDAVADSLQCASCSADAFPKDGEIAFNHREDFLLAHPINHLLKNVSDNGQLFFHTSRGLVPRDSNGKMDVYQYEDGRLDLISRGTGKFDSFFLDATPSGNDIFFVTQDQLVGWDTDQNVDLYDARVGGGFPEPPPSPPACEGDSCQPPPIVPNDPSPTSSGLNGPGNPTAKKPRRRCGAGKVRRQGKCRKRKRAATSQKRRNQHATRSHG